MIDLEFLDGRSVQHSLIDAEKIWFDKAPNKRIINKKVVFFG